ncbi:MAG: hypothetical protein H7222_13170 [Methylotenera sp.]|nr:hypothetical protein [Oligoflexia bacterium]
MTVAASILAIGTELTSGQILNRNASWIAQKLEVLGIKTVLHETVADDHAHILLALDRCAATTSLVFVTGGLGPTTDDFTRDVITKWMGDELVFDDPSWQKIVTRLKARGIRVAPSNKQQCYFPSQARILENAEGTANAFAFERSRPVETSQMLWVENPPSRSKEKESIPITAVPTRVWVLPGPPREGQSVWTAHIQSELKNLFPELKPPRLLRWNCLGKSESELGEIVEAALKGSGFSTGYRAHVPYIEVKVWIPAAQNPGEQKSGSELVFIQNLEKAIEPWMVSRGDEDLMQIFLDELRLISTKEFLIQDNGTFGILSERLGPGLRDRKYRSLAKALRLENSFKLALNLTPEATRTALFTLTPSEHHLETGEPVEWKTTAHFSGERYETILQSPFSNPKGFEDRLYRHLAELTLKTWIDWLQDHQDHPDRDDQGERKHFNSGSNSGKTTQ